VDPGDLDPDSDPDPDPQHCSYVHIEFFSDLCFLLNQNLHNHTVHINDDHILLFFSLVCVDCYTLNWLIVCTLYKSCI